MKPSSTIDNCSLPFKALFVLMLISVSDKSVAQNCPVSTPVTISSNPNTYYPGLDNTLSSGSSTITLGAAQSGTISISTGDLLLIIQMQGAQINSTNTSGYGDGVAGVAPGGYLSNSELVAGNMEYAFASNTVPLTGGALSLVTATTKNYKNATFGTDGQYRFQVIRVGLYYDLTLGGTLSAPAWNGSTGGVLAITVTNNLNFNGQTITAAGKGFRGGGARQLAGGTGGLSSDMVTLSTKNFNGSKGEGIAGTPRFVNNNGSLLDNGIANEGYPGGSYAAGAPGNAGGGGTDGRPSNNDENSGGGGGSNGGAGGRGGNSWRSNLATGGEPGAAFQEKSPSRLVMGGGGGAGTTNDGTGTPASGFASSGAAGGGIVLITAATVSGTGSIDITGASGNTSVVNDGTGGGGAGGSALIYAGGGLSGITVLAAGGKGGTNSGGSTPPEHGPGGGGGGGVIYSNSALNAASSIAAGLSGRTTANSIYGAGAGSNGISVQNITILQLPPQNLNCNVLALRFKTVNAKWQQNGAVIGWQVANESAIKNYTVEKSTDNKNFSVAGVIPYRYSSDGNNTYSFTDADNHSTQITYYRIRTVSEGSKVVYSSVISIRAQYDEATTTLAVSPNPATGATASIRFTVKKASAIPVQIRMLSVNGVAIWQKQYKATEGVNVVPVENLTSIPNGLYFIQYFDGLDHVNVKMIVKH